jgi:hypothetical protein
MSTRRLSEAILDGGIRSVNFFNGRLLSGEDLTAEQQARQQADERLGRAIGDGIAYGLEVAQPPAKRSQPSVLVNEGLAINRRGHALQLSQETEVVLVRPLTSSGAPASGFAFRDCQPPQQAVYLTGAGLYLLVLSPVAAAEGRAQVSGLGNSPAACNTKYKVDAVQFRLLPLPASLLSFPAAKLRNRVAYECFGISELLAFPLDPFNEARTRTALLDRLRLPGGGLTDCDVPLAVIHWTSAGVQFVDMWSVRRRLTQPGVTSAWPLIFSGRRASEGEAMILQFQEQIDAIFASENNPEQIPAAQRFDFLPPAGMLPMLAAGSPRGFRPQVFFGGIAPKAVATIDGAVLRSLFRQAADLDPIVLASASKVQLYVTFENLRAVQAGQRSQITVIFASHHLPFRGAARFNYAQFESGRFAPNSIR